MEYTAQPTNSTPELTAVIAQAIYTKIKQYGTADSAFKNQSDSKYDPEHFEATDKEIDRIVKELNEYASGKIITPEEFHYDEETGEKIIDVEEERYVMTTETDLVAQVESELLDVKDILNDIEPNGIWDEFKTLYTNNEGI